MENNYNCLDLDIVKEKVIELASIEEARNFIIDEKVEFNPLIIKNNCLQTSEAMKIIQKDINVQFSGIKNVEDSLIKSEKQLILNGVELNEIVILHNHMQRIKNIFNDIDEELSIKDYTDSLILHDDVISKIEKCIDNSGELKEDATPRLKEINKSINSLNSQIYSRAQQFISKYSSSLQETSIYLRENRVTFLIKNSDKNKYKGYSYGSSSSGLACYVEPEMFIDMNNQMLDLQNDKQDEINRILRDLTYYVQTISNDYRNNYQSIVKLNVIFAKANYGIKYNAIIPNFIEDKYFSFKDLCHPLLNQKTVVSNSYKIYSPYQGIVISGTNTGGKTVSLKAIGISILMSYLGIPIIASSADIPFYKNIYVDIDDNQSIQNSLSTFSAHISNINNILREANENSLILIDELISGTDPKEAEAISLAILDQIKKIGSIFVITTHFDEIKNYSYKDENIMLSSVGFDMNELKPTYKYYENSIGQSNAIDIASRYIDDIEIINNARRYVKEKMSKQDELLSKLSNEMQLLKDKEDKLNDLNSELENRIKSLNNEINTFNANKQRLKQEYLDELNDYINDVKNKALDKLNSISNKNDKKIINEIEMLIENEKEENIEFCIGDFVRINDNEQIGNIIEINNDNVIVNIKGIKVKTNKSNLKLMPKQVKKEVYKERKITKNVSKEINVVGKRVEECIDEIEEYLDKANGANLHSVKIIHGIGTGALRSAIRDRIKKLKYVSKFSDGDFYDGGSAVTIVEFK